MGPRGRKSVLALSLIVAVSTLGTGLGMAVAAPDSSGGAGKGVDVSALAKAKSSGKPVEIVERRTETSEVYVNPSGTTTVTTHLVPVRVRQGDTWVPVDTDLAFVNGRVVPKAAVAGLELSDGGDGPLVKLNDRRHVLELSWPGKLPKPKLDGPVATYPEVMPGVDLRMTAEPEGFSQLLVVKDAKAAKNPKLKKLSFGVKGNGLKMTGDEKQGIKAVDAKGRTVFSAPAPRMWDSGKGGKQKQAVMDTAAAGGSLSVVPDRKLLTGADTAYPVYVDPTFSAGVSNWAEVRRTTPTTSYWNDRSKLNLSVGGTTNYLGVTDAYRGFFQVDVPNLNASRSVLNATLNYTTTNSSCVPLQIWSTGRISSATTWNNQPTWNTMLASPACANGAGTLSVKSTVQAAAAGGSSLVDFGLRSTDAVEQAATNSLRFDLSKVSLSVEYNSLGQCFLYTGVNYKDPEGTTFTKEVNCQNTASAVRAEPYTNGAVTGSLLAGSHSFVCWRSGDVNAAGNRIWYYVKGDTSSNWTKWQGWGYVPADKLNLVGAEPYPGLPACNVYNVTAGIASPQDFDSDGVSDVLAVQTDGNVALYPGLGNGTLGSKKMLWTDGRGTGYTNLFTGDFNKDGIGDVAGFTGGVVWWWPGNGSSGVSDTRLPLIDNRYKTQYYFDPGLHAPCRVASASDFNSDGNTDIMAICGQGSEQGNYDADAFWWWPGDGDGGINATSGASLGNEYLYAYRTETEFSPMDVTGDGRMDIARMPYATTLELNPGPLAPNASYGTGARIPWAPNGFGTVTKVFAGDFNGDRKGDMAGVDSAGSLWWWPGSGDGTFGTPSKMSTTTDWGTFKDLL
ncbi:VCBS repeat-containing protein [Streptomyces sannanensis]|uniref:VCBS repeat-containing protein n=2 Tax=Streptomyces sannanensis TaxID=285536 RepID=A0ABP6SGV3_9ACTN